MEEMKKPGLRAGWDQMKRAYKIGFIMTVTFFKKVAQKEMNAYAAQAAFFLLLSVVPMTSLALAVTTYLPFSKEDVLHMIMQGIPQEFDSYISDIINDLYSRASSTVISLSAVTMLWSSSKGIVAVMDGFDWAYSSAMEEVKIDFYNRKNENFILTRLKAILYTIILLLVFAAITSLYMVISHYYQLYIHDIFHVDSGWKQFFLMIRYILGWVLFFGFILMLYVIFWNRFEHSAGGEKSHVKEKMKEQVSGAAFSAVAWLLISRIVLVYVEYFPNFSLMYGSLAGIVIAMLWLYFCMYFLLMGASLNVVLLKAYQKRYLTRLKKMIK